MSSTLLVSSAASGPKKKKKNVFTELSCSTYTIFIVKCHNSLASKGIKNERGHKSVSSGSIYKKNEKISPLHLDLKIGLQMFRYQQFEK